MSNALITQLLSYIAGNSKYRMGQKLTNYQSLTQMYVHHQENLGVCNY